MKIPLVTGVVILSAAALTGWYLDGRIAGEKEAKTRKIAETARLKIPDLSTPQTKAGGTVGQESGEEETTKKLAAEVLAFAREMAAAKRGGQEVVAALRLRMVSVMGRVMALNPAQLRILITETLGSPELDEPLRQEMLEGFLTQMGKTAPAEALSLWRESPEKFTDEARMRKFISATLGTWSRKNQQAAMEWARTNSAALPGIINDDAKRRITSSAAVSDPGLAFRFVRELKIEDGAKAAAEILENAAANPDPKARTGTLEALRAYLAGNPDAAAVDRTLAAAMPKLAAAMAREGFASCTAWIADSRLNEKELASFVTGIPPGGEEGSWIEWMGRHLPADKSETTVRGRIAKWAADDHKAVGNWLNATPDGPIRQAAVSAFAETVARYEPESAEQWAMTLPAGALRDETLRRIRSK